MEEQKNKKLPNFRWTSTNQHNRINNYKANTTLIYSYN